MSRAFWHTVDYLRLITCKARFPTPTLTIFSFKSNINDCVGMFSGYEEEKRGLKTGTIRGLIPTAENNLSVLPCFVGDAENHNNRLFEHNPSDPKPMQV